MSTRFPTAGRWMAGLGLLGLGAGLAGCGGGSGAAPAVTVRILQPAADLTVEVQTTVHFEGAADSTGGPLAAASWTFSDVVPATSGYVADHLYLYPGTFQATFQAQDATGARDAGTRTVTVTPFTVPRFEPDVLPDCATAPGTSATQAFRVDDGVPSTTVRVGVTARSGNLDLLPDTGLRLEHLPGVPSWTLTLFPASGRTGTAPVTVTAVGWNGVPAERTFNLVVE